MSLGTIEQKLMRYQDQIKKLERERAEIKGQLDLHLESLCNELGISVPEKMNKKEIANIKRKAQDRSKELDKQIKEEIIRIQDLFNEVEKIMEEQ